MSEMIMDGHRKQETQVAVVACLIVLCWYFCFGSSFLIVLPHNEL